MLLRIIVIGSFLALAIIPLMGQNASIAGNWHGLLMTPVGDIELEIKLEQAADGSWKGTLDIPAQNVTGLGLKGIRGDKDSLGFTIVSPGDPTFSGVLIEDGQAATGQLKQGSGAVPLKLARSKATLARIDVTDDSVSISEASGLPSERPFVASTRHPAIQYSTRPTSNAIDQLNRSIADGKVRLKFDRANGYLGSVLDALKISAESQMLVFSKTSVQASHITPANPRALFFTDDAIVGFIRQAPFLEIAVQDPQQGSIFYTLDQEETTQPRFQRRNDCLGCHESRNSMDVPGMIVRSVAVEPGGVPSLSLGNYISDHRSPLNERWGGWYVTGVSGAKNLGNTILRTGERPDSGMTPQASSTRTLVGKFDLDGYSSPHSDIAALLVFNHQMHMMNLLTRINWEARVALHEQEKTGQGRDITERLLAANAVELVDYLLFVDEAPLGGKIETSSAFAETFAKQGPRDSSGRSLRQLDLERRLLRYPCSYMIYSAAFDGLPVEARNAIYKRMWDVLSGAVKDARYARLSRTDREGILEILRETKKDLPGYFGAGPRN